MVGHAARQLAEVLDLAEDAELLQHGGMDAHVAEVADLELDRDAQLAVFVDVRRLQGCDQAQPHVRGFDVRNDVERIGPVDADLLAEGVPRRHVKADGADIVGRNGRRNGKEPGYGLSRRKIERVLDGRIDLVVDTDAGHRVAAVVGDRDREGRALLRCRVRLHGQSEIDHDRLDRDRLLARFGQLAPPRDIIDARQKRHIV